MTKIEITAPSGETPQTLITNYFASHPAISQEEAEEFYKECASIGESMGTHYFDIAVTTVLEGLGLEEQPLIDLINGQKDKLLQDCLDAGLSEHNSKIILDQARHYGKGEVYLDNVNEVEYFFREVATEKIVSDSTYR